MFRDLDFIYFIKGNRLDWIDLVNKKNAGKKRKISSIMKQRETDWETDPEVVSGTVM